MSQEELAESAMINLKTIQHIENNQIEPHGKTLNLISEVLGINAEDILDHGKKADKNYLTIFHLTVLTFLAISFGNIIIPLIMWMNKKDKITIDNSTQEKFIVLIHRFRKAEKRSIYFKSQC